MTLLQILQIIKLSWSFARLKIKEVPWAKKRFKLGKFSLRLYLFISSVKFFLSGSSNPFKVYEMQSCFGHDGIRGRKIRNHSLLRLLVNFFKNSKA